MKDEIKCVFCNGEMSKNPHPEAGKASHYLEVGTMYVCIPCTVNANQERIKKISQLKGEVAEKDEEWATTLEKYRRPHDFDTYIAVDIPTRLWNKWEELRNSGTQCEERVKEYDFMFDLRHKADMRAIKMWRKGHPERKLRQPDHADMVCFLLERLDKFEATLKQEIVEHLPCELEAQSIRDEIDKAKIELAELSKKLDDREIDLKEAIKEGRQQVIKEIKAKGYHKAFTREDWKALSGISL